VHGTLSVVNRQQGLICNSELMNSVFLTFLIFFSVSYAAGSRRLGYKLRLISVVMLFMSLENRTNTIFHLAGNANFLLNIFFSHLLVVVFQSEVLEIIGIASYRL